MMNTPPRSRHERRRQQTRKLLIQSAVQLVLEKGYDAISIQDITDLADLGRGTFYIHFKDKEEVVWSAVQDLILELEQKAHKQYVDGIPDQPEYFGLLYIFQQADQNRDLFRLIFSVRGSAMLTRRVQDLLAAIFLYDLQNQSFLRDSISDVPLEIVAQMTTGLITRMIDLWLDNSNNYTAEQMAGMMYQVLYRKKPPNIQS